MNSPEVCVPGGRIGTLRGAALAVLLALAALAVPKPAAAFDCLLDTNNDDTATDGVDSVDEAGSAGGGLACGGGSYANAEGAVAIGIQAVAFDPTPGGGGCPGDRSRLPKQRDGGRCHRIGQPKRCQRAIQHGHRL
jgi:hypothetical protein